MIKEERVSHRRPSGDPGLCLAHQLWRGLVPGADSAFRDAALISWCGLACQPLVSSPAQMNQFHSRLVREMQKQPDGREGGAGGAGFSQPLARPPLSAPGAGLLLCAVPIQLLCVICESGRKCCLPFCSRVVCKGWVYIGVVIAGCDHDSSCPAFCV